MDRQTEQAEKLRYERRRHALESLRLRYRAVVRRIDYPNHGFTPANTDAEFAEMLGRHLGQITTRAGWTSATNRERLSRQAIAAQATGGLPALLGLITSVARAIAA